VGEFAASLAHEIRNPLTAIRVDLQHLTRHAKPDVAEREALDRALRQVDRLDRAVSSALELARGGAVHLTPTPLDPVIRDDIAAAGPEAAQRQTRVSHTPGTGSGVSVLADAGALHQLFLNLLLNAIQAVDNGGTVQVESAREDDRVVVSITDDGRGIPADQQARIFDPFYTTKSGGTGLGLAVARRIVISLGGEITIRSGESRGTTATVVLRASDLDQSHTR
jgi:two-component system sensor histidine kinase HydH